jgi:glutamate-5-semialdehyde dehydrogenase
MKVMNAPLKAVAGSTKLEVTMANLGHEARAAARVLALAPAAQKNRALAAMAKAIRGSRSAILAANDQDVAEARSASAGAAFLDRLTLKPSSIEAIATGLEVIRKLKDPVGAVMASWRRPNGMRIERVRVPLGVIGVIYESRPNVTADAGALCLKAGNAVVLRGGSDSFRSSRAIHAALVEGLVEAGLPAAAITLVPTRWHDAHRTGWHHRRDRAARRQKPRRPRSGRGTSAGLRASGGRLPRLC